MSLPKPLKHRLVQVEFLDHCMSNGTEISPIPCVVVGTLIGHCRHAWYVATWIAGGIVDSNTESFTILKKVVTKITPLKRGRHVRRKKDRKKAK